MLSFSKTIFDAFETKKKQVDVIFTDFGKAVDSAQFDILIDKSKVFLKWIDSYLHNRKKALVVNRIASKSIMVYSGVLQGSHFSSILFNVFINEVIKFF